MPDIESFNIAEKTPAPKRDRLSIWALILLAIAVTFQTASQFGLLDGKTTAGSKVASSISDTAVATGGEVISVDLQVKAAFSLTNLKRKPVAHPSSTALQMDLSSSVDTLEDLFRKYPSDCRIARRLILVRAESGIEPLMGVSADKDHDAVPPPLNAFDNANAMQRDEALMWRQLFSHSHLGAGIDPNVLHNKIESCRSLGWYQNLAFHQLGLRSRNPLLADRSFADATSSAQSWFFPRAIGAVALGIFLFAAIALALMAVIVRFTGEALPPSLQFLSSFLVSVPAKIEQEDRVLGSGELFNLFAACMALFVTVSLGNSALISATHWESLSPDHKANLFSFSVFAAEAITTLFTLLIVIQYARKRGASLASEIGFSFEQSKIFSGVAWLTWGVAQPLVLISSWAATSIFPHMPDPDNPAMSLTIYSSSFVAKIALFFTICILGPIFEEVLFRGLLYQSLRNRFGVWKSILVTGIVFGLVHPVSIVGSIPLMMLGWIFGWLAETKKSLLPSMLAHCLQNTVSFLIMVGISS